MHRADSCTGIPPCKIKPTSIPICALLRAEQTSNVKDASRGEAPRRRGTVTHERQRDSNGLAALSGQITATVAQARRRKRPTTGLNSQMRLETFHRIAAVGGFRSTTQTGTRATRKPGAAERAGGRIAARLKARETLLRFDRARIRYSTEASKMFTAQRCEFGEHAGKWFAVAIQPGGLTHRVGYCAQDCPGHESNVAALTHHLQFQLDRETDLWLERQEARACEICGDATTLRARLGRGTKPRVLCADHQSSHCLQLVYQRRTACAS